MMENLAQIGESYISSQLEKQGWSILKRNYRHIGTEVDIIAKKGQTIVALEVKSRCGLKFSSSLNQMIPPAKIKRIRKGLMHFLTNNEETYESLRVDAAFVLFSPTAIECPKKIEYFSGIEI